MHPERYDDFYLDDYNSNAFSNSFNPQRLERDTFKQRNDPEIILHRFKLQLMNAYEEEAKVKDENGVEKVVKTLKFKKNTVPLCSKQGVEEIIGVAEKYINSHTVQGNMENFEQFRNTMRAIAFNIYDAFIEKRRDWQMSIKDCDIISTTLKDMVHLFLTRTLFNEERKGYGESYKETTHHETKAQEKPNFFQKVGGFLIGKGGR